jgi:predicted kinase
VREPDRRPALVLVTGLQGSGKSTVAEGVADGLGAPVLAWDWLMAALTPFAPIQEALGGMDAPSHRAVGWSLALQAAHAQARRGLDAVLDGMARARDVAAFRALGREVGATTTVVLTTVDDPNVQRARIEGRDRGIPGWHELTWAQVERSRAAWVPPTDVDLVLDSARQPAELIAAVIARLGR